MFQKTKKNHLSTICYINLKHSHHITVQFYQFLIQMNNDIQINIFPCWMFVKCTTKINKQKQKQNKTKTNKNKQKQNKQKQTIWIYITTLLVHVFLKLYQPFFIELLLNLTLMTPTCPSCCFCFQMSRILCCFQDKHEKAKKRKTTNIRQLYHKSLDYIITIHSVISAKIAGILLYTLDRLHASDFAIQ